MTDNHLADATPADDIAPEAVIDAPQDAPQADPGPSMEDQALRMGWTPKEQFRGDPAKWVDAETFVKRGEEFLPFLKANNKRMERELEKANARMEAMDKALKNAVQHLSRADERAYKQAKADLERELETAAAAGDVEAVKAVTRDIADLEKETVKPEAKPEKAGEHPALTAFKADNAWFEKDAALRGAAAGIADELIAKGMTDPDDYLPEVAKRIRAEFPHKFENPNRARPAAVEGAGGARRPAAKTYSDMPPEARQFCDELVRDKITTREKYVADFFRDDK